MIKPKLYREQEGFVNLGSLRLRKTDPPHSPCTKCNGLVRSDQFYFGSLTPNSQNLPARGIKCHHLCIGGEVDIQVVIF